MSINPSNSLIQPISSGATHDGPPPRKAVKIEVEQQPADQKAQEVAQGAIAAVAALAIKVEQPADQKIQALAEGAIAAVAAPAEECPAARWYRERVERGESNLGLYRTQIDETAAALSSAAPEVKEAGEKIKKAREELKNVKATAENTAEGRLKVRNAKKEVKAAKETPAAKELSDLQMKALQAECQLGKHLLLKKAYEAFTNR